MSAAGSGAPGARNLVAGALAWVAAEGIEGVRYGEVIDNVASPMVLGPKCIHVLADGRQLFCQCVKEAKMDEFNNRGAACDGRIIPRTMNSLGCPEVPLLGWKLQ